MEIYNEGTLCVSEKNEEKFEEVCKKYGFDNFNKANGNIELVFGNGKYFGTIEDDLKGIVDELSKNNIFSNGMIQYYGDYNGRYEIHNGVMEALNEDDCVLRDTSDEELLREVKRRCEISDDFVSLVCGRLLALLQKSH